MSEEKKQKHYESLFNEGREAIRKIDQEYAKFMMGCDECWGWSPDICGENCPHYRGSCQTLNAIPKEVKDSD